MISLNSALLILAFFLMGLGLYFMDKNWILSLFSFISVLAMSILGSLDEFKPKKESEDEEEDE